MTLSIIDFHSHYVGPHWPLSVDHHATVAERNRWSRINRQLASRDALLADVESGDLLPASLIPRQHCSARSRGP